jgi:hypothetical protein
MEEHYALAYGSKLEFSTTTFTFVEKDNEQESKYETERISLDAFTKGQREQQKLREELRAKVLI